MQLNHHVTVSCIPLEYILISVSPPVLNFRRVILPRIFPSVPSLQLLSSQPMLHTTPPPIFYIGNVPHTSPNRRQPPGFRSGELGSFGWHPSSKRSLEKKLPNLLVVAKNHSISTDGPGKSPASLEHTLFGVRSKRSSMRRANP